MDKSPSSRKRKVALCGFYGKQNAGDALLQYHLSLFLESDGACEVTAYSDANWGGAAKSVGNSHLDADVVVIGGGGVVLPDFWALRPESLDALIASRKVVAFVNVNIPEYAFRDAAFVAKLKALEAFWWVRDEASLALLREQGMGGFYLPDVAFRAGVAPPRRSHAGPKRLTLFLNHYVFAELSKPACGGLSFLTTLRALHLIADYVSWMTDFGWHVTLFPSQTSADNDDRVWGGQLYGLCRNKHRVKWLKGTPDWREMTKIIASSDLVVSTRFHSTALAMASGVPFVDITHHAKNREMLKDAGCLACSIEYDELCHRHFVEATVRAESGSVTTAVAEYSALAQARWIDFKRQWAYLIAHLETTPTLETEHTP